MEGWPIASILIGSWKVFESSRKSSMASYCGRIARWGTLCRQVLKFYWQNRSTLFREAYLMWCWLVVLVLSFVNICWNIHKPVLGAELPAAARRPHWQSIGLQETHPCQVKSKIVASLSLGEASFFIAHQVTVRKTLSFQSFLMTAGDVKNSCFSSARTWMKN